MPNSRPVTEIIPEHLLPFIAQQDASLYTPIDHAAWRYILRVSRAFFAKTAHPKYLAGLEETGISTERIPLVDEMDRKLRRFGWRAVPVSGFIPPAAFMEFQSLGILPIACEMRTLEHLAYTPAPDIVHEAAGHAPILADPAYATYLRDYGEVARKALFSDKDQRVYEAVRALSDTKEDPRATPELIAACQRELDAALADVTEESEAALLARMNWWTVEYGLIGPIDAPKIYGAGLLSSVGESFHCLSPEVRKIPFSVRCVEQGYDITRPQPQLFVTPDFDALTPALEEFARTMAFRLGGVRALEKCRRANALCTVELDSGVQLSGTLADFRAEGERVDFVRLRGPVQLSVGGCQLTGHGASYHREGYSSPIGRVRGAGKAAHELSDAELAAMGFADQRSGRMEFESGIVVEGVLTTVRRREGRAIVLTFRDCAVTDARGEALYRPEWGPFDLVGGEKVVSVFGGAADRGPYLAESGAPLPPRQRPKSNLTAANRGLNELYRHVRELREGADPSASAAGRPAGGASAALAAPLADVVAELDRDYPEDWLLRLELLELNAAHGLRAPWAASTRAALERIGGLSRDRREMIDRGLALLGGKNA